MHGVLLVDKPSGPTSFEIVKRARRLARTRKVGHAGTLDPLASGLLVICVGEATKLVPYLLEHPKRYTARVTLGSETDTDDADGEITARAPVPSLSREAVETVLRCFVGTIEQIPPAYSAIKTGGEALYRKARRGEEVRPAARTVTIRQIDLTAIDQEVIELEVECERGTYVRALARDIGRALDTRGHLSALRRTACSGYRIEEARDLDALQRLAASDRLDSVLVPIGSALRGLPRITVDAQAVAALRHGQAIDLAATLEARSLAAGALLCLIGPDGRLVAIARADAGRFQPVRVFGPA